jgi:hypothetical protein
MRISFTVEAKKIRMVNALALEGRYRAVEVAYRISAPVQRDRSGKRTGG